MQSSTECLCFGDEAAPLTDSALGHRSVVLLADLTEAYRINVSFQSGNFTIKIMIMVCF